MNSRNIGEQIIQWACMSPILKICENAGLKGKVILSHFENDDPYYGFDALNENFGNMIEMGVIDPAKVVI